LNARLVARYGGAGPGVHNPDPLYFALGAIQAEVYGVPFHPTLEEKAAAVAYAIMREHVFLDGNKRTGTEVLLQFLELNGATVAASDDEFVATADACANGTLTRDQYCGWVRTHRVPPPRSEV